MLDFKESKGRFNQNNYWWLMLEDFITNTGYYPILFTILELNKESLSEYFTDFTHIVLYLASFLQSALIALSKKKRWRILPVFNLTMVTIYTISEFMLGSSLDSYINDYFHLLFWGYSFAFMLSYMFLKTNKSLFYNIIHASLRTSIVFSFYFIYEIISDHQPLTITTFFLFLKDPIHFFLASALLMIGILLGFSNYRKENYLEHLSRVSNLLYEYSSWHLGSILERGLNDPSIYSLKRRKKLIMFMDIRNFTTFSEKHSTEEVVNLLTIFYKNAENMIKQEEMQILKYTADEIMCSFDNPEKGITLCKQLHKTSNQLLKPFNLSSGMALHYGEVLEGLIGGEVFKNFDIMGDSVNTANRMEKISGNRMVISEEVKSFLSNKTPVNPIGEIKLRGKERKVKVYQILDVMDYKSMKYANDYNNFKFSPNE